MNTDAGKSLPEDRLVTIDHVRQVLLADQGVNAQLISWNLVHFTKSGDNYASSVIALEVKYSLNKREDNAYYVVKLNPQRGREDYAQMNQDIFLHESDFYLVTLPELNGVMKTIDQPLLSFPKCFYSNLKQRSEQIYFEDLRKKGFLLFDRKKGMDVNHAEFVLRELARLHAASFLLQAKSPEPLEFRHKHLQDDVFAKDYFQDLFNPIFVENMDHSIQMLKRIGSYEKVIAWIEKLKPQVGDIFRMEMKSDGYNVICHGDCWNNNVLFRYDENGSPVEVMLIDLQVCRKASLAIDLNYFMYSSLTSEVRRPNLDHFLSIYYKNFKEVTNAGGMAMPFTEDELLGEFRSKNKIGALFSMLLIPIVLSEPSEGTSFEAADGDLTKVLNEVSKQTLVSGHTNPMVKSRFLSTFDEFIETGLIN